MINDAGKTEFCLRKTYHLEKFSCKAEEDLMSATMKLDDLMAGLEEFLNTPPTKKSKVGYLISPWD